MKRVIGFFFFFISLHAAAQFNISGYVSDAKSTPLSFASVVVLTKSDSSIVNFGLTNDKGKYAIDVKDSGAYIIQYTFLGYGAQLNELITNWENSKIVLPTVVLKKTEIALNEVSVNADRIPLKMKGDTIQYDAKAFKVAEGSDVEKLLEKLPGIEIDAEGNLTAQGRKVEKVLVDGKEFFGDDPKMATKNLEAKAIDKVEVLDKKSEEAEFTGVDDGNEQKTINLTLKEDFKKGAFGKAFLGGGTEETYKGKINYNRFNKNTQASLIANANNINERAFSYSEFRDFQGGSNTSYNANLLNGGSGNQGINNSLSAGLNLNHEFNKKVELTGYYYLIRNVAELDKRVNAENFTDTTIFKTNQNINNDDLNLNHSVNVKAEWKPNPSTVINLWSNAFLTTEEHDNRSSTSYSPSRRTDDFILSNNDNEIDKLSNYNSLTYKRKFKKAKRNIRVSTDYYFLDQQDELLLDNNRFGSITKQNQSYDYSISRPRLSVSYTEPLDSQWVVSFSYNFSNEENKPIRRFFDQVSNELQFNDSLSSSFNRVLSENKGGITFRRSSKKLNYRIGTTASNIKLTTSGLNRDFQYLTPFFGIRYKMPGSKSFNLRYYTQTVLPTLNQLVTIPDNINPNRNYIGNKNLDPEYSHNISLNYFSFDPTNSSNIYGGLTLTSTSQKIVSRTIVNSDFTTSSSPQNTGFYQRVYLYAGIGRPLKKLKVKVDISPKANFNRYNAFLNERETEITDATYSLRLSVGRLAKEKWSLNVGVNLSYNDRKYEANPEFDQIIRNYNWFARGDYELRDDFVFKFDYTFRRYAAVSFSESRALHFVSASLRKSFKEDTWALSLIANDIFNENIGVLRTGNINSLREENYNARAQYFMLALEVSLGKKPKNAPGRKKERRYKIYR